MNRNQTQFAAHRENTELMDLLEVRAEITRVNEAAGETVFNPAATAVLDKWIRHHQMLTAIKALTEF